MNNPLGLLLAMALASQSQTERSILDFLPNPEGKSEDQILIENAPEGTPEHSIYQTTGVNPLAVLTKLGEFSETLQQNPSDEQVLQNVKLSVDNMEKVFTPRELAAFAFYMILTA